MNSKSLRLIAVVTVLTLSAGAQARRRNSHYVDYINKYSALAVEQMEEHKIPASATLAQGLPESGVGINTLACKSNNRFGIKCGSSWDGRTIRRDDNTRNECFRAYRNPRDSYEDHPIFLKRGARYVFLFKLKVTDYKDWTRGLKKAGYAVDPSYVNCLITIIEDYDPYRYDRKGGWNSSKGEPTVLNLHQVYIANDIAYIVVHDGDTFRSLGKKFNIRREKLAKYNDLQRDYTLIDGDIIHLEEKKKKAPKPYTVYVVKDGDSMHTTSQKYIVRLRSLYKMSRKNRDYIPRVGDRLGLRQTLLSRYIRSVLTVKGCSHA